MTRPFLKTGGPPNARENQINVNTKSDKLKLRLFFGSLAFIALGINGLFFRPDDSSPRNSYVRSSETVFVSPPQQQPFEVDNAAAQRRADQDAAAQRRADQHAAAERANEEAARKAAEHSRYLERYLNTGFARKPGMKPIAIVVASEDGKLNAAVTTALAMHFKDQNVELLSSYFKPEFVSDKLFSEVFNGSSDVLHKLELDNSLDALLLARQTVRYSTNPSLENVMTANMRLEVTVLHVSGTVQSKTWTFTANGAGFKQGDARALAEERLIKQIGSDTKMSLN
jgi:hypothetical protein